MMARTRAFAFCMAVALLSAGLLVPPAVAQEGGDGGAGAEARTPFDRTLRVQVQLPPRLYAGVAQPLHCAVEGSRGRTVALSGSVRRAGQRRAERQPLFEPFELSVDRVALPRVELAADLVGEVVLEIEARTGDGIQRMELRETVYAPPLATSIVTDKPLYQPGQTVHIRSLSFDPLSMEAAAEREATVEIRNPQGILIWRTRAHTDEYGLLSHTFRLASEVPTGAYEIRVAMPPNEETQTFFVREYQLPKYIIDVETNQGFFLPDDEMRISVRATYAFGEPVRNAKTEIRLVAFDPQTQRESGRLATLTGTTDDDGEWRARFSLPREMDEYFGEASQFPLSLRVVMTDPGGLTEIASPVKRVAREPLAVQLLPENGVLVPGVENRVFVAVSYPDGAPAPSTVEITQLNEMVETDELGLGEFRFTPAADQQGAEFFEQEWELALTDELGHRPELEWSYERQVADGGPRAELRRVRLRAREALLDADAPLALELASAAPAEEEEERPERTLGYTVEVRKLGTTVLAQEISAEDARADDALVIEVPERLVGQLDVVVHELRSAGEDGGEAGVTLHANAAAASVYRASADALDVRITPNAVEFRPGEAGRIEFRATRRSGRSGPVVLGVDIVDTALFGLIPEERERLDLVLLLRRNLFDDTLLERFTDESLSAERREHLFRVLVSRHPLHAAELTHRDSATHAQEVTQERIRNLRGLISRYRSYFHYRGQYREPLTWLLDNAERTGLSEDELYDAWGNRILFLESYGEHSWVLVSPGPSGETNPENEDDPVNDDNIIG